jgi:uncharacterized protein YdaU (DUF1376 family)
MKIQYVQFQPTLDLLNINFLSMSAEQRGVYLSLKLYLYANGGKCPLDLEQLKKITNCENVEEVWKKIKKEFVVKKSLISNKNVNSDLRKAKKFAQAKRKAGLASGKVRRTAFEQRSSSVRTEHELSKGKETEGKVIEVKENITSEFVRDKSSHSPNTLQFLTGHFQLYENICKIIPPKNQSDRTSFSDIAKWVVHEIKEGRFDDDVLGKVIGYAREAAAARGRSAAIFTAILQKNIGWHRSKKL